MIPEADPYENLAAELLASAIRERGADAWEEIETNPLLSAAWDHLFPSLEAHVIVPRLTQPRNFRQTLRIARNLNLR